MTSRVLVPAVVLVVLTLAACGTTTGAQPPHVTPKPTHSTTGSQMPTAVTANPGAKCSIARLPLPDPACTPGVRNPAVTQATIGTTICVKGWTTTVRPPDTYTEPLKKQGIDAYGYQDTHLADYEEDHFLPLEVGGDPRDPANLWPEPHYGTPNGYDKDKVENAVKTAVCAGKVTLDAAQKAMLTDWTTALKTLGIG